MNYLSDAEFAKIYSMVPRLCVDLVIKNEKGLLLALRTKEPYKGIWNLPGGTVYKLEKLEAACIRIAKKETGLDVEVKKCFGYIEYLNEYRFGAKTHSVSIVIDADVLGGALQCDESSNDLKYFKKLPDNLVKEQKEFFIINLKN